MIETDEMWSEEYDDLSSESFTTLASSVSNAVTTTFEDSAEGYVLTQVDVMLARGEDAGKRLFSKNVFEKIMTFRFLKKRFFGAETIFRFKICNLKTISLLRRCDENELATTLWPTHISPSSTLKLLLFPI